MNKRYTWALAALSVAAAGAIGYYRLNAAPELPTVATAEVTRGDVVETVSATGTLQAVTTVQVGTQVSGTIKALHADFNARVRRGQVVAELEPSLFEAQVAQARASLVRLEAEAERTVMQREDAQQKLKRARELALRQLIPATDLETAEMNVRAAEAAVKAADALIVQARASVNQSEVNLAHTIIAAPIDGIVISRNVDVGQTVAASMQAPTLFVIARDLKEMQVNASIAESDIGRIVSGQSVSFRVDAHPSDTFTGTVSQVRLQPVVEQNVVSYVTVIDVPNPDLKLKPGMTANVTVEVARATNVLRVPNAALRVRPPSEMLAPSGQSQRTSGESAPTGARAGGEAVTPNHGGAGQARPEVWVQVDGRLAAIPVRVGITDGNRTAIDSEDLVEGQAIVTSITTSSRETPANSTSPLLPALRGRGAGPGGPPAADARRP